MKTEKLLTRRAHIPSTELELIAQELKLNASPSAIASLLEERTGSNVSTQQIRDLRKAVEGTRLDGSSPASRLLEGLRKDENAAYVALTATSTQSGLISIRQSKKLQKQTSTDDSPAGTEHSPMATYAETVIKALSLKEGDKVLLAVAWRSSELSQSYFDSFPWCFGLDVTNGTNQEKRPLLRATASTSERKNIPFFNAFLPSQCSWVFKWVLQVAFPKLFNAKTLERVQLIVCDQDQHCYEQIQAAIDGAVFPNALKRLCKWHKINRHFVLEARKLLNGNRSENDRYVVLRLRLSRACHSDASP